MDFNLLRSLTSNLKYLQQIDHSVLTDLCHLVWEFISKGFSSNVYNNAAQKLQISRSVFEDLVDAIACLIFYIHTRSIREEQFLEASETLDLTTETLKVIYSLYVQHEDELQLMLSAGVSTAQYSGLQWRLESELASRSRRFGLVPRAILRLDLNEGGAHRTVDLVSDIPNLVRWSEMLEQALAESRTQNARRIHRAVS